MNQNFEHACHTGRMQRCPRRQELHGSATRAAVALQQCPKQRKLLTPQVAHADLTPQLLQAQTLSHLIVGDGFGALVCVRMS
jgi:hypothetical protein